MYSGKPTKHRCSRNGFTLIEIMLVLTLIAILTSITMPSLRGFATSTRLTSSARAIRNMLNFARDMAITERTGYLVVFDFDRNRYWLASSETFDVEDASTSTLTSASNTLRQTANQQGGEQGNTGQTVTTPSRTSTVLGVPQEPAQNVSLSHMTTNHSVQSTQVNSGTDYIYFSPTGSSGDNVLYVRDVRDRMMSITVESATGRVTLQDIGNQENLESER